MDYAGPTTDDMANINALNQSFLAAVADSSADAFGLAAIRRMSAAERARLASAPFLLFSLREQDDDYWRQLLSEDPQLDLIDSNQCPDTQIRQLQVAGLGFLWQLARRNPYTARLVCGASVAWCEQLARLTLVGLLRRVGQRGDLLQLRLADNDIVWRRLLEHAGHSSYSARRAACHSALQAMLTHRSAPPRSRLPAAACAMSRPGKSTTRETTGAIREPKV